MTLKNLIEKTPATVYLTDGTTTCLITPWSIFYDAFKDCIIDNIEPFEDGLLVTLKRELVKKEG